MQTMRHGAGDWARPASGQKQFNVPIFKGDGSMKTCMGMVATSVLCVIGATAMAGDAPAGKADRGAKHAARIAERTEDREAKRDARIAERTEDREAKRDARIADRKEERDARHDKRMTEWQKRHNAFIAKLKSRLAKIKKLTDEEKTDIVAFYEQQYQENVEHRSQQHEENMKFFDALIDETGATAEQIKAQIKAHFAKQKEENQEHRAEQQGERKAEREKIKAEKQDGAGAATP
jgi:hypothetical protein